MVNGRAITLRQLQAPLIESYGLNLLLNLVQVELARQDAASAGVTVSPEDIRRETEQTVTALFKEANEKLQDKLNEAIESGKTDEANRLREEMRQDNERYFEQFLTKQRITRPEFDLVMETNAHLRKIVEPLLKDKITDESLREAFSVLYGENVVVRDIRCSNLQEIAEARRRLAAGEPFEKVAMELSRDSRTAPLGGELPAFSRQTSGLPETFKEVAFSLKSGEVSDPVQVEGAYHLIKLVQRIPPQAVKFETHKDIVREQLYDRMVQAAMNDLRAKLGQKAMETLDIREPVLKQQFQQRMSKQEAQIRDRQQIDRELAKQRPEPQPDTAPIVAGEPPAKGAATQGAVPERPPATRSGIAPDQAPPNSGRRPPRRPPGSNDLFLAATISRSPVIRR